MYKLITIFIAANFLSAFTFVGGYEKSTLPITRDNPTLEYVWDGKFPEIKNLDTFHGGDLANLPEETAMEHLINIALDSWSEVEGSFLEFKLLGIEEDQKADYKDNIFSITQSLEHGPLVLAAALPMVLRGKITDCDIMLGSKAIDARMLVSALIHELGHCAGLGHNHANYLSIMSYSNISSMINNNFHYESLSLSDKAALIYLYPSDENAKMRNTITAGCSAIGDYHLHKPHHIHIHDDSFNTNKESKKLDNNKYDTSIIIGGNTKNKNNIFLFLVYFIFLTLPVLVLFR